jgi:outer membrane immunogenic protein
MDARSGVESKLTANWSVKAEYLYFDLGHLADTASTTISIPAVDGMGLVTATSSFRGSIVRAGVNYSFNNPLVAKY